MNALHLTFKMKNSRSPQLSKLRQNSTYPIQKSCHVTSDLQHLSQQPRSLHQPILIKQATKLFQLSITHMIINDVQNNTLKRDKLYGTRYRSTKNLMHPNLEHDRVISDAEELRIDSLLLPLVWSGM